MLCVLADVWARVALAPVVVRCHVSRALQRMNLTVNLMNLTVKLTARLAVAVAVA